MKKMSLNVGLGLLLLVGCSDAEDKDTSIEVVQSSNQSAQNPTTSSNSETASPTQDRDVRKECTDELQRLEGCGQATLEEREYLEVEFCKSSDFRDGQVASVVSCLAQWTCGGDLPPCLEDSNPEPECRDDDACASGSECRAGVCQPSSSATCTDVHYVRGDIGDGTKQGRAGSSCVLPGECLSGRCVSALVPDGDFTTKESWCGNKGDCRNPLNADEACPSGYSCEEVFQQTFNNEPKWLCVRETVGQMCRGN